MNVWRSLGGMLDLELTSADPEQALEAFVHSGAEIRNIKKEGDLTVFFSVSREELRIVESLCKKRGDSLRIRKKRGLFWRIRRGVARPLIPVGILGLILLSVWLPTRVLFVRVEGNIRIPQNQILAAAEEAGIAFGASRREVRSERVKNALLSAVPQLQWAGVNTSGCTAVISVREKAAETEAERSGAVASVVAARDGYVLSCTATAGNLLVSPGMAIQKGQVLISGYTDYGLSIRAEWAEGEIYAQTNRDLVAVMPARYLQKGQTDSVKRKISLLIRKKRIFLWKDSGIWVGSCGRMYEEYYATLPGGFRLPFALCVETYEFAETAWNSCSAQMAQEELQQFSQQYLLRNMIAGKILQKEQILTPEGARFRLASDFVCAEMVGIARREQIGDTNGEIS